MSKEKFLLSIPYIVNNTHTCHEINQIFVSCVIKIIATLVASVAKNPLKSQLRVWCSLVCHACGRKIVAVVTCTTIASSPMMFLPLFRIARYAHVRIYRCAFLRLGYPANITIYVRGYPKRSFPSAKFATSSRETVRCATDRDV